MKFLTLNVGNFEGLAIVSPTELEQSSSETLDYMAHLTWICVLKSNWFGKSVPKRFGTLPKNVIHKLSKDVTCFQFQYGLCICMESAIVQLRFHQIWPIYDL